jgi:drug/metabolite transporter (DMT)-like permease
MARPDTGIAPILYLVTAAALWGIATVISKTVLGSVQPITFLIIQLVPSVCVLWAIVLATKTSLKLPILPLALLGVLNPGVSYSLSILGLTTTTASVATLLWAAEPALIVLVAWLLREERVNLRFLLATAAAAAGVVLVSGLVGSGDLQVKNIAGPGLILAGVLCCALYTVLMRRLSSTYDPLAATAVQQTAGLLWAAAIWPFEGASGQGTFMEMPVEVLMAGALSGFMYYGVAFWLYLTALRSVRATTAGLFLNLTPVFGIATAWIVLGERLAPMQWAGAAVIITSVIALLAFPSSAGSSASA